MEHQIKSIDFKLAGLKIVEENDKIAKIKAYVSIFDNIDRANERITKGAFAESLRNKLPKVAWSHDWNSPIGKVTSAIEDDIGLLVDMEIIKTVQQGNEAYELMKFGAIDEFSIGYDIKSYTDEVLDGKSIRTLTELELFEVSPVLVGCNPETRMLQIKSAKIEKEPKKEIEMKEVKAIEDVENGVKIILSDDTEVVLKQNQVFDDYLNSKKSLGVKVDEVEADRKRLLLLRKNLKQVARQVEFSLRITKQKGK